MIAVWLHPPRVADATYPPTIEHVSELPPDPTRLRAILAHLERQLAETETIGIYLRLQRDAVRQALEAAEKPPSGRQQVTRDRRPAIEAASRPRVDGYKVEKRLSEGHPLGAAIHVADCTMTQRDTRPVSAEDARQALGDPTFFRACGFCRPDSKLGVLDS